jgi:tetratricopeptide (TPR) repeat protein
MNDQDLTAIQVLLKTSSSATAFILFGDTTLFDNLADQVRQQKMNTKLQEMANEITAQNVLQQATRFWINDALDAKTVQEVDGKQIAGQVVRMDIAAAFEERLAFRALVVTPMMRVRASGRIEAGQMVSGPPELLVNQGAIMLHLGESELALSAFDRALKGNLTSPQRAVALNNKGLALRQLDRSEQARRCFEEALEIDPGLEIAKKNLAKLQETRHDKKDN